MNDHDGAFERLRGANPTPVVRVEDRPSGAEMLAWVKEPPVGAIRALRPRPATWRRGLVVAAVAAVLILLAVLPFALTTGDEPPVATTVTTTSLEPATGLTSPLFEVIDPGRYSVDAIGTPFTIEIEGTWALQRNAGGHVVVTHEGSSGPSDRDVAFVRPTGLVDPADPYSGSITWPLDDIRGWLELIDVDGTFTEPVETTLGGLPALRFDVVAERGFDFVVSGDVIRIAVVSDVEHRIWWIPQGDAEPIVVIVGAGSEGATWFDAAQVLLDTVRFGPVAPHPLSPETKAWERGVDATVPAGMVRVPALGGLAFELAEERLVRQGPGEVRIVVDAAESVTLFQAAHLTTGEPAASIDEVVEAVAAAATLGQPTETTMAGDQALVVDVVVGPPRDVSVLRLHEAGLEDEIEWSPPVSGRLWVVDTDRGILVIAAGTLSEVREAQQAIAIAERVAATLELIDPATLPG